MYQVIGVKRAITLFGLACVGTLILWGIIRPPDDPTDIGQWWKIGSAAVGNVSLLVWLIGQTAVFPFVCRIPFLRDWFPDIDGEWHAELESNWALIAQRAGLSTRPRGEPIRARLMIVSRLFFIKINLISDDNYSSSSTSFVGATRNEEDGSIQLVYVFRNTTLMPLETDSASHNGAASVQVIREPTGELSMQGSYWTDRNWTKAMNTAGRITLRRQ
jgi:hypothetical protein